MRARRPRMIRARTPAGDGQNARDGPAVAADDELAGLVHKLIEPTEIAAQT